MQGRSDVSPCLVELPLFMHLLVQESTPQSPPAPGEPGLVTLFDGKPWLAYDRYRVFVRVTQFPSTWQYMGLYKATKLPAWTPGEVKRQRPKVGSLLSCQFFKRCLMIYGVRSSGTGHWQL